MKKIVTIVGARPQFIKAAPLSKVLRESFHEVLVHTGQHYDEGMSAIFFEQLRIPSPDYHLGVGSGGHGEQTAAMLQRIESVLLREQPDAVVVYGDTNSTLAGAVAAAKLHLPIAHVEAGLRSFNRRMPEEINRILTDHVSTWLFCPSEQSAVQLRNEGLINGVHVVGDIMLDAVLHHQEALDLVGPAAITARHPYAVCTVHRAENTDDEARLREIFDALAALPVPVIIPVHPRTKACIAKAGLELPINITTIEPIGYLNMLSLMRHAAVILTDSGGLQKEAYYLGIPCVTLRRETEWVETVTAGWNTLAGTSSGDIQRAVELMLTPRPARLPLYGTGDSARRIVDVLKVDLLGEAQCVESLAS